MSDNTDGVAARRSNHTSPEGGEIIPPPLPRLPDLAGETATEVEPALLPATDAAADSVVRPRKRLGGLGIALIVAIVVAIVGWTAFGVEVRQLSIANSRVIAAQSDLDDVEATLADTKTDVTELTVERDRLKGEADGVAEREATVAAREEELAEREAAVKAVEDYQRATTLKDGYTYTAGLTMEPGAYRANSTSDRCYWAIYRSGSNHSDIVDNDLGSMGAITVTIGDGQDFESNRCGDWTKVG